MLPRTDKTLYGPLKTDGAVCNLLNQVGHVINVRTVKETRKKLGLRKLIQPDAVEQDLQHTIKSLLAKEYQNEAVLRMHRSEPYEYLRQGYPDLNIVGRDRVYNIAREMDPTVVRHYPKDHPLHKNRPYKLSGKRKSAKDAADAASAATTALDPSVASKQPDSHTSPVSGYDLLSQSESGYPAD
ncbi:hypothetical protein D6C78_10941 [Aureobasidium pullulans]|uniref:Uncharacterized protein n=1 Tax=Aureobasidium pullulans TaxID=5580 RepID=A0A4T0B246_AURPU|nr:hypothetical protein D6C78_10941 [Aureobasidium pullulans]